MKLGWRPRKWLEKKCKLGFRGYPVGTIAFYGPDDRRASKVTAAVIVAEDTEPVELRRWFAENGDVRNDAAIFEEICHVPSKPRGAFGIDGQGNDGMPARGRDRLSGRRGLSTVPLLGRSRATNLSDKAV
jgi:hypothetical protein